MRFLMKLLLIFIVLTPMTAWADYTKQIDVFGIPIIATDGVADSKLLHAASVLAEYLDNDQDGTADDLNVLKALVDNHSFIFMIVGEFEEYTEMPSDVFEDNFYYGFNLYAGEVHLQGSSRNSGFDATLEEVLHLVTHAGYSTAYPKQFGVTPNSDIANAMDKARGGRFMSTPSRYPANAWYTYDDDECEYECMVTEYFYWSLTSLLGAQSYGGRASEISREWKLSSANKLKSKDKQIFQLLSALPIKVIPKGDYKASALKIKSID